MPDVTKSVSVKLASTSLAVGTTTQATATVTTEVPDSSLDTQAVVWSSSAPSIATVDANGLVKAVAAGTAVIKATVGGVSSTASVTVTALPFVLLDAAGEATLLALPVGSQFNLKGPTGLLHLCQVSG